MQPPGGLAVEGGPIHRQCQALEGISQGLESPGLLTEPTAALWRPWLCPSASSVQFLSFLPLQIKLPLFGLCLKAPSGNFPLPPSLVLSPILVPPLSTPRSQMGSWGGWKDPSVKGFIGRLNHPIAKSTSVYCILTMSGILLGALYAVCH